MSTTLLPIASTTGIVRDTASTKGRTRSVSPATVASRHLHYGRIILDAADAPITVETLTHETGFVCMKGAATATVAGQSYAMVPYDALYVPRQSTVTIAPGQGGCDLTEISAPVEKSHPVQFVKYADVVADSGLHFTAGGPGAKRELNILIGKNVTAGRIMCGVTFSEPGNWTSWPPHEHAAILEEAYLYLDMPAPGFGVQFVFNDKQQPELATFVREGDLVMIPQGYHPNVAAPGGAINFLWMMAAVREDDDRQFGVVNVHPDFATGGSGLDPGKAKK
jgi:5-deoxy-glucuronate isomerase